ncbi:MAG: hypothetical protein ACKOW9_03200 [Candidatus Paceibacterota bacterium]
MACLLNNGVAFDCINNQAGVKEIYLFTFSAGTTYSTNASTNEITGATNMNNVYKFEFPHHTASYTDEAQINQQNQSIAYTPTVSFKFNKMTAALRDKILLVARTRVCAMVTDNNGQYILLGQTNGLTASAAGGQTGVAATDSNDYHLTLSGLESELGQFITYGAFSAKIQTTT